jgi:hypothetical protein
MQLVRGDADVLCHAHAILYEACQVNCESKLSFPHHPPPELSISKQNLAAVRY